MQGINNIILASQSPRRKELLDQVGIACRVVPGNFEEKITSSVPEEVVTDLSRGKCREVSSRMRQSCIIIGADTIVSADNQILGKPYDKTQAKEMLLTLQGNTHQVYTGVTIIWKTSKEIRRETTFFEKTDVTFYPMSDREINEYLKTDEPMDKAGAYGIQGLSAVYIKKINGDYNNVVGLPVAAVYQILKSASETYDIQNDIFE